MIPIEVHRSCSYAEDKAPTIYSAESLCVLHPKWMKASYAGGSFKINTTAGSGWGKGKALSNWSTVCFLWILKCLYVHIYFGLSFHVWLFLFCFKIEFLNEDKVLLAKQSEIMKKSSLSGTMIPVNAEKHLPWRQHGDGIIDFIQA